MDRQKEPKWTFLGRRRETIAAVMSSVPIAAFLLATVPSPSISQAMQGIVTITHPLNFTKNANSSLTQPEVSNILSLGGQIIGQCRSTFSQYGPLGSTAAVPSAINSSADMAAACGASAVDAGDGYEITGVRRKVRVVNAINWCGTAGANIVGCAYTPGTCLVVRRTSASLEGILVAHEFGHSKGLGHRTDSTDAVMFPSLNSSRTKFNQSECSAIRQLSLYGERGAPQPAAPLAKVPIEEFVTTLHPHGVPYDEARQYTSVEVQQIAPWLKDKGQSEYWVNVAATVGIVADARAYANLRDLILSVGSGSLPIEEYDGRVAAIISLGYVVRGSGSADARKFLESHTDPTDWDSMQWKAPYHSSAADRNVDLAAATALALSLIGDEESVGFLEGIAKLAPKTTDAKQRARLSSAIQQALRDARALREGLRRPSGS